VNNRAGGLLDDDDDLGHGGSIAVPGYDNRVGLDQRRFARSRRKVT